MRNFLQNLKNELEETSDLMATVTVNRKDLEMLVKQFEKMKGEKMEIPKKLYHATLNLEDAYTIAEGGFDTKITYFCSEIQHAAEFLQLIHGDGEYHIVEVDVSKLNKENLKLSEDHNPVFYSKDLESFVYFGWIDEDAISDRVITCQIWRGKNND